MKNSTKYNRSEIMTDAWEMYKFSEGSLSFSVCLKTSWNVAKGVVTNGVTQEMNVKELFNCIYFSPESNDAHTIFSTIIEKSNNWKKDIASKAIKGQFISEKQAWAVAYEFKSVA